MCVELTGNVCAVGPGHIKFVAATVAIGVTTVVTVVVIRVWAHPTIYANDGTSAARRVINSMNVVGTVSHK